MIDVLLRAVRYEAAGIISLELTGEDLPRYSPGAHIDVLLPNGLTRSYSLVPPRDDAANTYRIAVLHVAGGRGGSACVHEMLRVGQRLCISRPRQNFPCDLNAEHSVLLAGGIGITPLFAMARALAASGRSAELIYCARSRAHAAFLAEIEKLHGVSILTWFDEEKAGLPDLTGLLVGRNAATRFYACGPPPMLAAFTMACAGLGYQHASIERFTTPETTASPRGIGAFDVVLRRSGRVVPIPADSSILKTLLTDGIACDFSCTEGLCGACETRVLDGTPDHRDHVLTEAERAGGQKMMICVSRCVGERLTLDL